MPTHHQSHEKRNRHATCRMESIKDSSTPFRQVGPQLVRLFTGFSRIIWAKRQARQRWKLIMILFTTKLLTDGGIVLRAKRSEVSHSMKKPVRPIRTQRPMILG
ncbi:hypothetical protein Zmor_008247 [Zophobas morio]|uniref:Uncharacterized protein n=1 Tax=Zophobas morio TaxID=2755281 RepID=A0AA38MPK3_9CUCU|nr:hypothetical protein Zmor_008247 [Zophobas morio]